MRQTTLFQKVIDKFEPGDEQLVEETFEYKTEKISFVVHYKHNLTTVEKIRDYIITDRVAPCRHGLVCNNSGRCYSCPPVAQTFEQYKNDYKKVLVYCFFIDWNFKIKSDNPYFRLINANRTLSPMAWSYGQKLELLLGGKDCIDGRCPICQKCNYPNGCLYPDLRRSSVEAIGIDASRVSREVLKHDVQWYRKVDGKIQVPQYLSVIHMLLTNSDEPKSRINY